LVISVEGSGTAELSGVNLDVNFDAHANFLLSNGRSARSDRFVVSMSLLAVLILLVVLLSRPTLRSVYVLKRCSAFPCTMSNAPAPLKW
jgi:hypothetical protein